MSNERQPFLLKVNKPFNPKYTVVDLFSGPGGMSTGFFMNGFALRGAVDFEVGKPADGPGTIACNRTYKRNLGIAPKFADISNLDPAEYRKELGLEKGELTVLIACAPCTGFSQKNASNHTADDPRNSLVQRVGLFVKEFRPEWMVMENVKELLRGNHHHHWNLLWQSLKQEGYSVYADVKNLADYGVPQNRLRATVIARRDGQPIPKLKPTASQAVTVREAIDWLRPITWNTKHNAEFAMHICPGNSELNQQRITALPADGGSWRDLPEELWIPSMRRATRKVGSYEDIYGRMWWDRPASTITRECSNLGNGRYLHPQQHRLMSVLEAAILQGFPEDYYFEGPLSKKYNQIGDAVPPKFSVVLAEAIRRVLDTRTVEDPAPLYDGSQTSIAQNSPRSNNADDGKGMTA